jgi:hypothetical protein
MRFVIIIAGVIASLWYGVARHGWTGNQYYVISFVVLIPICIAWFLLERVAWNYDLRRKGISSNSDVWGVDQFPAESGRI